MTVPVNILPKADLYQRRKRRKIDWIGYSFFLPAFIVVAAVSFVPIAVAFRQSLYRSQYLELGNYVGLSNFMAFLNVGAGSGILWNSLIFVVGSVALALPLGFALALALNEPIRFKGLLRTILIAPWLISNLVTALLWGWLLNAQFGPVSYWLEEAFAIHMPNAVTSPALAMPALILCNVWNSYPLVMVLVLAALQTIPKSLTEAATIDGAGAFKRFLYITLPMVSSTTLVALVLTTLNTFNNITLVLVLTGGGPLGQTETLAFRVFQQAFQHYNMGIASAGAVVIFLLNVVFALAYIRALRPIPN